MQQNIVPLKMKIIRTKTNQGELCKQQMYLLANLDPITPEDGLVLMIKKTILSDNLDGCHVTGIINRKTFKGKYLIQQIYSIKLTTLQTVCDW